MIGFAVLACAPTVAHLAPSPASTDAELKEIVVNAKRRAQAVADVELKRQVEVALASDAYFYSEHVPVTIAHGIATLHGLIFDDWDMRNAIRISRRIPGVRKVINDLEIKQGGE